MEIMPKNFGPSSSSTLIHPQNDSGGKNFLLAAPNVSVGPKKRTRKKRENFFPLSLGVRTLSTYLSRFGKQLTTPARFSVAWKRKFFFATCFSFLTQQKSVTRNIHGLLPEVLRPMCSESVNQYSFRIFRAIVVTFSNVCLQSFMDDELLSKGLRCLC